MIPKGARDFRNPPWQVDPMLPIGLPGCLDPATSKTGGSSPPIATIARDSKVSQN